MSGKRVLIVSANGLFREGLKHILDNSAGLTLTRQTTSLIEAEELAREKQVDVVIIDCADETEGRVSPNGAVTCLLAIPGVRVISVGLNTGDMWIYRQERVEEVSVEDLMAALDN
jgi:DNA-binding NarL/FixJ family response regulator